MSNLNDKNKKSSRYSKKAIILAVSLICLLVVTVGGTLAYLIDITETVTNTFTPATVTVDIEETFEDNKKENVKFQNTSDIEVYIRATLVEYWKRTSDGAIVPKPTNAKVTYLWEGNVADNSAMATWFSVGSIFYYRKPVAANDKNENTTKDCTTNLLEKVTVEMPDGYEYYLEVHAEAIQSKPIGAVEDAWKDVKVDNTTYYLKVATTTATN